MSGMPAMVDLHLDARALLEIGVQSTAWYLAGRRLIDDARPVIAGAGDRSERARQLGRDIDRLEHLIRDPACLHALHRTERWTAALRTVAVVAAEPRRFSGMLPLDVLADVAALDEIVSPSTLELVTRPMIEMEHWAGLPLLRTQPEWAQLAAPITHRTLPAAQLENARRPAGSLEHLTLEAILAEISRLIVGCAHTIVAIRRTVPMTPGATGSPNPSTAAHVDRHGATTAAAGVDWVGTLHEARTLSRDEVVRVPWCVAVAIEHAASLGFTYVDGAPARWRVVDGPTARRSGWRPPTPARAVTRPPAGPTTRRAQHAIDAIYGDEEPF
jgi:hypothetical protein